MGRWGMWWGIRWRPAKRQRRCRVRVQHRPPPPSRRAGHRWRCGRPCRRRCHALKPSPHCHAPRHARAPALAPALGVLAKQLEIALQTTTTRLERKRMYRIASLPHTTTAVAPQMRRFSWKTKMRLNDTYCKNLIVSNMKNNSQ